MAIRTLSSSSKAYIRWKHRVCLTHNYRIFYSDLATRKMSTQILKYKETCLLFLPVAGRCSVSWITKAMLIFFLKLCLRRFIPIKVLQRYTHRKSKKKQFLSMDDLHHNVVLLQYLYLQNTHTVFLSATKFWRRTKEILNLRVNSD